MKTKRELPIWLEVLAPTGGMGLAYAILLAAILLKAAL